MVKNLRSKRDPLIFNIDISIYIFYYFEYTRIEKRFDERENDSVHFEK